MEKVVSDLVTADNELPLFGKTAVDRNKTLSLNDPVHALQPVQFICKHYMDTEIIRKLKGISRLEFLNKAPGFSRNVVGSGHDKHLLFRWFFLQKGEV